MNVLALEWVEKAEGDFLAASTLLRLRHKSTTDAVCFHCQQCAEKYLKAFLQQHEIQFSRTHDLVELLLLCQQTDETFLALALPLQSLNSYSVEIRYPGRMTSLEEAQGAFDATLIVRRFLRDALNLSEQN
ncbi:MAG: hypothetical protein FOGNACKC_03812 [Anaerolineae bacterium]|nr:hypothetical protein [Anaerolineae bacterium]